MIRGRLTVTATRNGDAPTTRAASSTSEPKLFSAADRPDQNRIPDRANMRRLVEHRAEVVERERVRETYAESPIVDERTKRDSR